jgi:hypothetical protein
MELGEVYGKLQLLTERIHQDSDLTSITNNSFIYPGKVFISQFEVHGIGTTKTEKVKFLKVKNLEIICHALFRAMIEILRNTILSCLIFKIKKKWKFEKSIILLTHYSSVSGDNYDLYFGNLQNVSSQDEVEICAIFHGNIIEYLAQRKKNSKAMILSKCVKLTQIFQIARLNVQRTLILIHKSESKMESDPALGIYLHRAARYQSSRQSYSDLIIVNMFLSKIQNHHLTHFVSLYEGHGHEIELLNRLSQEFPRVQLFAYQHAPVVRAQLSFFLGFGFIKDKVRLLVTGPLIKELVSSNVQTSKDRIIVLGSVKNLEDHRNLPTKDHGRTIRLLLAPEGDPQAVSEMIAQLDNLLFKETSLRITLRLHPNLRSKISYSESSILRNLGVSLSSNSLIQDLEITDICIYRSSAVAIQGLMYGVTPLYLSTFSKRLFDPLDSIVLESGEREILNESNFILSEEKRLSLKRIGNDYFSVLNPEVFLKLLDLDIPRL